MLVFIRELFLAEIICKEWIQEVFPEADVKTAFDVLNSAIQSPLGKVYGVFGKRDNDICGFFWGEGNPLDKSLFINTIYVRKNLRKNPKIVGEIFDFLKNNYKLWGFKYILFLTKKPNFYIKRGCKVFDQTCLKLEDSHGSTDIL